MMHFIAFLETAEDGDGILHAWLVDHDWLEASLEGGVLFDVFAIFIERRGADGVQFAASELGFEHIGSVCRAFGCAGAHNGMELVDKEDDLALGSGHLLEKCFQPVFELAAELGAGDHGANVHGNDPFVLEGFGHVAGDDASGESFDDGRLADARLSDEDGIVLGPAGEDLHGASDFVVAADHRIDLSLASELGEIAAILFQRLVFAFRVLIGHALVAPDALQALHKLLPVDARILQHRCRRGSRVQDGKEEVLGAEEFVLQLGHFAFRGIDRLAKIGAKVRGSAAMHGGASESSASSCFSSWAGFIPKPSSTGRARPSACLSSASRKCSVEISE